MRKATLGNLSYQHPLREEEHTAWRGLARQGPLTAVFGDGRQHSRSATPPLSHCPPQSTAGGSAPGRCTHEPPWAAPQRGSRRGAPLGPRSRAGCGEPALHHGMPSAPLSPAGPPSPASSYRKHRDMLHKEMGWQNHPAMHSHVQKANYSPHSTNPSTHIQCYCLILVLSLRQGLLSPPVIPSVHATPSFLT